MKNSTAKKRKQVPAGYLVVGVDPHKKKHAAVFVTQDFMNNTKLVSWQGFQIGIEGGGETVALPATDVGGSELGVKHVRRLSKSFEAGRGPEKRGV